jgi:hypothetical protein
MVVLPMESSKSLKVGAELGVFFVFTDRNEISVPQEPKDHLEFY